MRQKDDEKEITTSLSALKKRLNLATPEAAGVVPALGVVQRATMSRVGDRLQHGGVGHDIAPSCLKKASRKGKPPTLDAETPTRALWTDSREHYASTGKLSKVRKYVVSSCAGTCVPETLRVSTPSRVCDARDREVSKEEA